MYQVIIVSQIKIFIATNFIFSFVFVLIILLVFLLKKMAQTICQRLPLFLLSTHTPEVHLRVRSTILNDPEFFTIFFILLILINYILILHVPCIYYKYSVHCIHFSVFNCCPVRVLIHCSQHHFSLYCSVRCIA